MNLFSKKPNRNRILVKKWKRRDLIMFLERLELYVSSGMAIHGALKISEDGISAKSAKQKICIRQIRESVEAGALLSFSLGKFLKAPLTITGIIAQGENSGHLARSLGAAKALLEREDELIKKCLSAMAYPLVIGIFAGGLTIGLVRGIMPQIIPMLKGLNMKLPFLTRAVIFASESLMKYFTYVAAGIFCFVFACMFLYKRSPKFKSSVQSLLIRVPIIGRLYTFYSITIFLRACGTLIESGLAVFDAYSKSVQTISFLPLRALLNSRLNQIENGVPLGNLLNFHKLPSYIPSLLNAGESSGTLGQSIARAAAILDRDIEYALKKLTSLIEPVLMAGMGTVVGTIALSIMMPIYDISKILQH